jgi:hypothetical protein
MKGKPILLLDFDGVLHSYTSGWKGARSIPDPPVPGALHFLVEAQKAFNVCIYSSRSRQFRGKRAMQQWLEQEYVKLAESCETTPEWLRRVIAGSAFADPWIDEVRFAIKALIRGIGFPTKKPAAFLTIDDRCIQFNGRFPDIETLLAFKPWNKKEV